MRKGIYSFETPGMKPAFFFVSHLLSFNSVIMKSFVSVAILPLAVQAVRIVQSNDDGWAESYIRTFNDALNSAGYDVVLSAPAENKSGSSKSHKDAFQSNLTSYRL